jgi:hypothetical protein
MATRSAIVRPTDTGYEGRYCHYDGYPAYQGRQLWATLQHFGFDAREALRYALREDTPGYWSAYQSPVAVDGSRLGDYVTGRNDGWITTEQQHGLAYIYLLHVDRLEVRRVTASGEVTLGQFRYDEPEPNWDNVALPTSIGARR